MKLWLRVDSNFIADDARISGLITAARDWCETYTALAFVTQTRQMKMDALPGYPALHGVHAPAPPALSGGYWGVFGGRWGFSIPGGPVQSAVLTYVDQGGNPQTLATGAYTLDTDSTPTRVFPIFPNFWPLTQYSPNSVAVTFVCGYGVPTFDAFTGAPTAWAGNPVPESIRTAIMFLVAWMYGSRESQIITTGVIRDNPTVTALLAQYKDWTP